MVILSIDKTLQFLQKLRIENRNKCKEFYILLLNSLLGIVKDSSEKFGIFSNRICMSVIVEKTCKNSLPILYLVPNAGSFCLCKAYCYNIYPGIFHKSYAFLDGGISKMKNKFKLWKINIFEVAQKYLC